MEHLKFVLIVGGLAVVVVISTAILLRTVFQVGFRGGVRQSLGLPGTEKDMRTDRVYEVLRDTRGVPVVITNPRNLSLCFLLETDPCASGDEGKLVRAFFLQQQPPSGRFLVTRIAGKVEFTLTTNELLRQMFHPKGPQLSVVG